MEPRLAKVDTAAALALEAPTDKGGVSAAARKAEQTKRSKSERTKKGFVVVKVDEWQSASFARWPRGRMRHTQWPFLAGGSAHTFFEMCGSALSVERLWLSSDAVCVWLSSAKLRGVSEKSDMVCGS
jgi:hypothetical protein